MPEARGRIEIGETADFNADFLKDKKPTWLRIRAATIYDEKEFLAWIGGISHSFIANTV
ncbi:hypothetical protein GCM10011409_10200 [Lentibacillus populi]|uniref:Uncharacterized protein n=1 Tax=Lentibacillus populi TaxID=1827502 RepID=A0A9W5X4D6_9BACI|nr:MULTISPECIES: hypothetical protein [Bacillaceae]GGB34682.1 hypothetical protein GCM10011409_10200 [Lentibacillus populi]